MQAKFLALSRNLDVVAVRSGGSSCRTGEGNRLAALKTTDNIRAPPAYHCILHLAYIAEEFLAGTKRQLVTAAEMENVAYIVIERTVIEFRTVTWHVWRAVPLQAAAIEQVLSIAKRL